MKEEQKIQSFVEDEDTLKYLSGLFKTLSDPTRLKIIYVLSLGTYNVKELEEAVGMSQSSVSHQLSLLRYEGLVRSNRQGRKVYYSLDDEHVLEIFRGGYAHALHKSKDD